MGLLLILGLYVSCLMMPSSLHTTLVSAYRQEDNYIRLHRKLSTWEGNDARLLLASAGGRGVGGVSGGGAAEGSGNGGNDLPAGAGLIPLYGAAAGSGAAAANNNRHGNNNHHNDATRINGHYYIGLSTTVGAAAIFTSILLHLHGGEM
ncbi:PREDICTED: uncharacterized protein LOC104607644 [Nelumbo nucifera]|uniref:Uncharacterized protein n=2 Tax=Nelumbo nucifera TaxID=4432 RepID=A0A822Y9C4_NELNU|nr:PREDICTED: uncharacterized protein LOC104607644 [Nelumbo nucifera]DAD28872.1 TPA_asm: hypothetical protein HUJ06_030340 [Nelumbo nucifera]